MNGWQVMAVPLTIVVRLGVLVVAVLAAASLWDKIRDGWGHSGQVVEWRPARPVSDQVIVIAYNAALLDGWPAGELLTFMEAGRRAGTSGEHVRSVIARHWAA